MAVMLTIDVPYGEIDHLISYGKLPYMAMPRPSYRSIVSISCGRHHRLTLVSTMYTPQLGFNWTTAIIISLRRS